ncbi:MAG TPA: hypothetical protein VD902_13715, partial [Symbiobacteriaceae bacterium]|nr:hypothetical protein [Symbiobacteriaceae bacterium]
FVLAAAFFLAPPPPARGAARSNQVRIGLLTAVFLVGTAALSAVLAVVYVRIHWLGMGVVEYLLPYFLSMAVVLLLLRTFWPQDYGFPVAGELTSNLGQVLRGIGIFLGLVGALGSVVHMSLSNFMLNGPRILPFMGLALAFWLYFAQEEGLKRAVAGSLGPWAAGLVGLTAKLLMVGTWLLAAALPNPQPFLPLVTPIIAVLMLLLEALSYALHLLRYSSAGAATCTALTLAWITAASFPLV